MSGAAPQNRDLFVKNAAVNNLKNIDVIIPVDSFTCIIGVSGCGKSSLVYDTIYAESQRNFFESMSINPYSQKLLDKPNVEYIENLRPALSVSQYYINNNPRSTVGTITDISHYLRTLFAFITGQTNRKAIKDSFFSFNNPTSCCPNCKGIGEEYCVSADSLVPDKTKTLSQGAITCFSGKDSSYEMKLLVGICEEHRIDMDVSFDVLKKREQDYLLYADGSDTVYIKYRTLKGKYKQAAVKFFGAVTKLERKLKDIDTPSTFANIQKYLTRQKCTVCNGTRLRKEICDIKICNSSIAEIEALPLEDIGDWVKNVDKEYCEVIYYKQIKQLLDSIINRINNLIQLKLGYTNLNRAVPTLSGGELQRVRIANQLNCSLTGMLYILDEPCKGLHYKDMDSIISATKQLVNKGNTVIAIEHNIQYINSSDKIIEMGPVGGPCGGYIIKETAPSGSFNYDVRFKSILKNNANRKFIELNGINFRNIINQSVKFPVGEITCITGVSGSGKSTLAKVLNDCVIRQMPVNCKEFLNPIKIQNVQFVTQAPIGKTSRSTIISYLGIYDDIRTIFASSQEAKKKGITSSDFSMNVAGGRCEECQGIGYKKVELSYLPESLVLCEECLGKRFKNEILEINFKKHNINDILDKSIDEIKELFAEYPIINSKLQCMTEIGLGYLKLGQMSMNLSGGEAQRIKLAKCLGNSPRNKQMFIMDEPTAGLNGKDVDKLLCLIEKLSQSSNTIVIIEHNLEFIARIADYIIDFGIVTGKHGGKIASMGNTKSVLHNAESSWSGIII